MRVNYFKKISTFFNITSQYINALVSYWHFFFFNLLFRKIQVLTCTVKMEMKNLSTIR
jgi:hypothetical protein